MSGYSPEGVLGKALETGTGSWLKLEMVEWGRQSAGLKIRRRTLRVAETFMAVGEVSGWP